MGIFDWLFGGKPKQQNPTTEAKVVQQPKPIVNAEPQPAISEEPKSKRYRKPKYEDGIDYYKIIATLDDSTCTKCGKMDLRVYKVSEMKVGVNYPPFCKHCRCVAVPWMGDLYSKGKRFARDENGKGIQVNADMTWAEWRKIYGGKK